MSGMIKAEDLKSMMSVGTQPALVDVRRQQDFDADPVMIPGAVKKDPGEAETWAKELPTDRPVVIYCVRGGSVSTSVQQTLAQQGVNAVYVEGGIEAWKKL